MKNKKLIVSPEIGVLSCEAIPFTNRKKAESLRKAYMKKGCNAIIENGVLIVTYVGNRKLSLN